MTYYYNLRELPLPYRTIFESGQIPPEKVFYPYAHRNGTFGALVFLVAIPFLIIVPAIMLYGTLGVLLNPTARAGLEALLLTSPSNLVRFMLLGVFIVNGLGSLILLIIGLKMVWTWWLGLQAERVTAQGHFHYGLLLDEENLVCRLNQVLGQADCILLPKKLIIQAEVLPRRGKGRDTKDCLIRLEDDHHFEQTIRLGWSDFELPPHKELVGIINAWCKKVNTKATK